jgi:hypothetical protein
MIVMRLGAESLAHVRFAVSPLTEAMRSVHALDDPGSRAIHLPWVTATRAAVAGLDLAPLRALVPGDVYTPDFTSPPPAGPLVELEDELAAMLAVPPEQVAAEVARTYRGRPMPPALAPFVTHPERAVAGLADLVRAYWDVALAPSWPRIRALLQGDVLHRARTLADGGARVLFADMDPAIAWADGALRIRKRAEATLDLGERGLLFVPSVFVWPRVVAVVDPAWQPTVVYPARGIATLWDPGRPAGAPALAALLGAGRAAVLAALDEPLSTTDLSRRLGVSAGGVSQHLSVLRAAGLVHGQRAGRSVLYMRSAAGDQVVEASR